ncbi:hypothetical protein [Prescottella agglutinans]|uniref:Secreted protein n=1 Tax=Prescottella agglutinans TaxID=1644129 RepID=A0ABT6M5F4_9NOCA|nr:hypothetical protein [Prescottella agglutinans]MDH6278991.1 hypothetical protein [Prescottella agglutinans]
MRARSATVLTRSTAAAAIASAALLIGPAIASAAPSQEFTGPVLTTAADGNVVGVTVQNPNVEYPTSTCGAVAIDSAKVPKALDDPTKLFEPGFVAWTSGLDAVPAGATKSYTTGALADGVYAFVGACIALTNPTPVLGEPQIVPIGGMFGSLGTVTGSLGDIIPNLGDLLGGLVGGLLK